MARPLRIQFPGAVYHVMSRGNDRGVIVRDDADRQRRLDWLCRTVETYGWRLHAFALMKNHEHLFLQTPEANLSAGMQFLNGSYTSYFNHRHGRVGHLFQGRFKGHLVDEDGYYLEVSRYIHLNPVRARLVERPEQWRWSSYGGYHHARRALPWISYGSVLGEFSRDATAARRAYRQFVNAGLQQPPKSPFAKALGGVLLGSGEFIAKMQRFLEDEPADRELPQLRRLRQRPSLDEIVAVVAEYFGEDPSRWSQGRRSNDVSRSVAAYLARHRFGYPATAVAEALGYRSHGSVRYAITRVEAAPAALRKMIEQLEKKLRY